MLVSPAGIGSSRALVFCTNQEGYFGFRAVTANVFACLPNISPGRVALTVCHGFISISDVGFDGRSPIQSERQLQCEPRSSSATRGLRHLLAGTYAFALLQVGKPPYFGLSPSHDGSACTLSDIKSLIEVVSAAVSLNEVDRSLTADIDRTLLAAQGRCALDDGAGLLPDQLAALVCLGQKSMRNALAPSSGTGLEMKDGTISAASALKWLSARGDFKTSVWRQASTSRSSGQAAPALTGEIFWVPFASDNSEFDPAKCLRNGKYTVGPKGSECTFADYREALDALARMKPAAYWRRPNTAGNWGIVTAVGFHPRTAEELSLDEERAGQ